MMIFHGWLQIEVDDSDDVDIPILHERIEKAIQLLSKKIQDDVDDKFSHFKIRKASNGLIYLSVHGNRNHRFYPVVELFHWAAKNLPHSFGLLYVWDDEDHKLGDEGYNFENEFRVFKVAKGTCTEHSDPFLSPCIPTIEDPY